MSSKETTSKSKSLFNNYQNLMIRYPFLMNAIQAGVINGSSVIVSQFLTYNETLDKEFHIQWYDVITMSIIAMTLITPILLIFYSQLNKLQIGKMMKLLIDQLIFSPLLTFSIICYRFVLLGYFHNEMQSMNSIFVLAMEITPKAMRSSWLFWIPARFFVLNYVPPMYHLLVGSILSFVWNIVFSMILS